MDPRSSKVDLATAHMTGSLLKRGSGLWLCVSSPLLGAKNKWEKTGGHFLNIFGKTYLIVSERYLGIYFV